ncbi:DUF397 domain-containing protein [Actinoallomurus acanthiterrae]
MTTVQEVVEHPGVIWRKSFRSMANQACVEVALTTSVGAEADSADSIRP